MDPYMLVFDDDSADWIWKQVDHIKQIKLFHVHRMISLQPYSGKRNWSSKHLFNTAAVLGFTCKSNSAFSVLPEAVKET